MTYTPPEVYRAVEERAGKVCECILENGSRCCSPGDWRGLCRHHEPPRSRVPTRHVYTEKEIWLFCYPCHDRILGKRLL